MYRLNLDDAQTIPDPRRCIDRLGTDRGLIIETESYGGFYRGQTLRSRGWRDEYQIEEFFLHDADGQIKILLSDGYIITIQRARDALDEMNDSLRH